MGKNINRYWFVTLIALFLLNFGGIQATIQTNQPKSMAEQASLNPSINSSIYDSLNAYYQSAEYKQMQKEEKICQQKAADLMKKRPIDWFFKKYGFKKWEYGSEWESEEESKLPKAEEIYPQLTVEEKKSLLIHDNSTVWKDERNNDVRLSMLTTLIISEDEDMRIARRKYRECETPTSNHQASQYIRDILQSQEYIMTRRAAPLGGLEYTPEVKLFHKYAAVKVVTKYGDMLEILDPKLRDDKEIVLIAIQSNPFSFQYTSNRLKDDDGVARFAVSKEYEYELGKNDPVGFGPNKDWSPQNYNCMSERLKTKYQDLKIIKYPANKGGK